jgi:ssDNA-binding Zn-finger/Zn-ribbon topoisomerase 1
VKGAKAKLKEGMTVKCEKCGQHMVRLEDGTLDCGCPVEASTEYPSLDRQVDPGLCTVNGQEARRHFPVEDY